MPFWRFLDCGYINLMLKSARDGRADQALYLFLSISLPPPWCMTRIKQFCRLSSFWWLCALSDSFTFLGNQLQLLPGNKWSFLEYQKMTSHILRHLLPQLRQWPTPAGAHKNLTSSRIQIIHLLLLYSSCTCTWTSRHSNRMSLYYYTR